jgi:hypothetical protein
MIDDAEAMSSASHASHAVFNALGGELLAAPEGLQLLLEHRRESYQALEALARIGPSAIAFAPQLIERMDHQPSDGTYRFDGAEALGSIGRGHGGIVDAMLERLRSSEAAVRAAAAATLAVVGTDVAGRTAAILARLHEMFDANDMAALGAMASVGRDDPSSRRRVIDLARPRPPQMKASTYGEMQDAVMFERGHAIYAMTHFTAYPGECVPVLIEAIDTFEEYNPDETYAGPVARVANALARFGPAAGAAALPLSRHLQDRGWDFPRAVLAALSAVGPAATGALPALEAFRATLKRDDPSLPDLNLAGATTDPDDDPVGVVILKIRGG